MNHVLFGAPRIIIGSSLALWMCLGSIAFGQWSTGPAPEVYLIHQGAAEVLSDLKVVMDLTAPEEQKQYKKLLDHLELTLPGVDRDRPLRTDLLLNPKPYRMRTWIPVSNERTFWRNNLMPNGIGQQAQVIPGLIYKLSGNVYPYFLWLEHGYGQFVEVHQEDGDQVVTDFVAIKPAGQGGPGDPMNALAAKGYEFGLEGTNKPGHIEDREKLFFGPDGHKESILATHRKLKTEEQDLYDLNHLAFSVQLDEVGRIFTQGQHLVVNGLLDEDRKQGIMDAKLVALPGTPLQASMESMGSKTTRFATIPRSAEPVLSLRMNLFLDEMRQRGYLAILDQLRKVAINGINTKSQRTAAQKTALVTAANQMYGLAQKTLSAGSAIGMIEMQPDGQYHTAVAAMQVANGQDAMEILKTLQGAGSDLEVKFDVAKFGDVSVHSYDLDSSVRETYKALVGTNTIYVGIEANAVWLAGGPNALKALETAIGQAQPTQGTEEFLSIAGRFGPWFAARQKVQGDKLVEPFRTQHRLAVEAAQPGDDRFNLSLKRDGQDLLAKVNLDSGVLRWLGKSLAHMAKEQIPEK
ncbi:hypothetical protein [Thalassoroseus pseudoceratinae]|uniref:hypothetical protein n=1 Tax=Thalassoroseus pseudoceratinae TaxID=2713176 RepID=UPI001422F62B|nr:hypothetical protein [Thalassoroseus pseudoceratinae]